MPSQWENEGAFRVLLHKIATKATPERLAKAVDFALENDEAAVKYVSGIIMKDMKQLKPTYKLRVFYAFSSIARASVAKHGSRSKYAARFSVKLQTIAALLTEIPPNDKIQVGRVLQLWWRDGIFPPSALTKLQSQFPASPAPNAKSKLPSAQKPRPIEIKKSHLAGAASAEKTHRYWDSDLGTEVVITKNVRHDAPASPVRDIENPVQELRPADDSPLPFISSRQGDAAADENTNEIDEDEDDLMPRAPKRRMITLESNRRMGM